MWTHESCTPPIEAYDPLFVQFQRLVWYRCLEHWPWFSIDHKKELKHLTIFLQDYLITSNLICTKRQSIWIWGYFICSNESELKNELFVMGNRIQLQALSLEQLECKLSHWEYQAIKQCSSDAKFWAPKILCSISEGGIISTNVTFKDPSISSLAMADLCIKLNDLASGISTVFHTLLHYDFSPSLTLSNPHTNILIINWSEITLVNRSRPHLKCTSTTV